MTREEIETILNIWQLFYIFESLIKALIKSVKRCFNEHVTQYKTICTYLITHSIMQMSKRKRTTHVIVIGVTLYNIL